MSLQTDVDRGIEICTELAKLKRELEEIDGRIKVIALKGEQVELKDPTRDGRQFRAVGTEKIIPVIFTADKIVGSFQANSPAYEKAIKGLGDKSAKIGEFFKRKVVYENCFDNGKKFRAHASEILDDKAPLFITAVLARDKDGIPKSDIKICWEEQEPVLAEKN